MPRSYFMDAFGINLRSSALLAFLPWLVMALGSSISGFLADAWLARSEHALSGPRQAEVPCTKLHSACLVSSSVQSCILQPLSAALPGALAA